MILEILSEPWLFGTQGQDRQVGPGHVGSVRRDLRSSAGSGQASGSVSH